MQPPRDEGQISVDISVLFTNEKTGDRGIVVDDEAVFAIEQFPATSEDRHLANAVLLGQYAEVLRAQHLQSPQTCGQRQHQGENAVLNRRQLDAGELFTACDLVKSHISQLPRYRFVELSRKLAI